MVEIVDRSRHHHDVAFGREIVQHEPGDGARILYVDVVVDDHEHAREHHHVAEPPQRAHHFFGVAGIGFANRNDREVMKAALDRKIHVDDFGQHELQQRKKEAFRGFAEPSIFHRRFSDDGGGIDRIAGDG